VSFERAVELVRELLKARDERTLTRLPQRWRRVDLRVCDELGFVPFDRAGWRCQRQGQHVRLEYL
jgi:DNA replication protein DnaC